MHLPYILYIYITIKCSCVMYNSFSPAPNDYTNVFSEPLTFSRNIPTNSITISITDDMLVEGPESFTAELSVNRALNPGVMLNPDTATVNIIDDDGNNNIICTCTLCH